VVCVGVKGHSLASLFADFARWLPSLCGPTQRVFGILDTMSDEEPLNPKPELEEACKPRCIKALLEYQVGFNSLFFFLDSRRRGLQ